MQCAFISYWNYFSRTGFTTLLHSLSKLSKCHSAVTSAFIYLSNEWCVRCDKSHFTSKCVGLIYSFSLIYFFFQTTTRNTSNWEFGCTTSNKLCDANYNSGELKQYCLIVCVYHHHSAKRSQFDSRRNKSFCLEGMERLLFLK